MFETARNPECVLRATGQSTEWTITNIRLGFPSPNQSRARGSSAMAGSGLNMELSVSSRSVPIRVLTAQAVRRVASAIPAE